MPIRWVYVSAINLMKLLNAQPSQKLEPVLWKQYRRMEDRLNEKTQSG